MDNQLLEKAMRGMERARRLAWKRAAMYGSKIVVADKNGEIRYIDPRKEPFVPNPNIPLEAET